VEPPAVQTVAAPLSRWQSAWRYTVAALLSGGIWATVVQHQWRELQAIFWLELVVGPLAFFLLRWRRSHPLPIALVITAFSGLSALAAGPSLVAMVSVATTRRWSWIVTTAVSNVLASTVFYVFVDDDETLGWLPNLVVTTIGISAVVAIGMYLGTRRELVATLRDRAERAEQEQAWRVAQARTAERARIAREMHDVLAHRLSLVAMHAGALSYRRGLSEQEVADAAEVIQCCAHEALSDLREVLGVLRDAAHEPAPDRPQPTLADVPALVEEAQQAGAHVRLHNGIGELAAMPVAVGRSAYRVIQESLTNARKHAPDTVVDIHLHGRPGEQLRLEVRNPVRVGTAPSRTPGAGLGLLGLTERAELSGGRLEHELTEHGDFVVRAWLPWPA